METLDVSRFSRKALYGPEGHQTDLAELVLELRPTIEDWAAHGWVKQNDSLGFAIARPDCMSGEWKDPYKFVWFVAGWGPRQDKYIANAVRKLIPMLRTGSDTATLRLIDHDGAVNPVDSETDGVFPMGDFYWGGGKFVNSGNLLLPSAVSALTELQDDWVAGTIGGRIGSKMLELGESATFA